MKASALALLALAACGPAAPRPRPQQPLTRPTSAPVASAAPAAPADPLGSYEALAADSLVEWPGTRDAAHKDGDAKEGLRVSLTAEADTCARAFVRATGDVTVTLAKGAVVLASGKGAAVTLGAKGPVCVRKGEELVVTAQGDARVRVLLRASP